MMRPVCLSHRVNLLAVICLLLCDQKPASADRTGVNPRRKLTLNPVALYARHKQRHRSKLYRETLGEWRAARKELRSGSVSVGAARLERLLRPRSPLRDRLVRTYASRAKTVDDVVAISRLPSTHVTGLHLSRKVLLDYVQSHPRVVSHEHYQQNRARLGDGAISDRDVVRLAYNSWYPTHANEILDAALGHLNRTAGWDHQMRSYLEGAKLPTGGRGRGPDLRAPFFLKRRVPTREDVKSWSTPRKARAPARSNDLIGAAMAAGGMTLLLNSLNSGR